MQSEWTMPWKKDLAKLKQDLKQEDPAPPKAPPPPKTAVPTPVSMSIEEEDAIFLSAMGLRPQPRTGEAPAPQAPPPALVRAEPVQPAGTQEAFSSAMGDLRGMKPLAKSPLERKPEARPKAPEAPPPQAAPPTLVRTEPVQPAATQETFSSAMSDLKGMKPLAKSPLERKPEARPKAPAAALPSPATEPPAKPEPKLEPKPEPRPEPEPVPHLENRAGAREIHLAAGMAVEVDGVLDLRGHARSDGEERLKERILDGYALGWRTLHVTLGPDPELREMVLALLSSPAGRYVSRYAQAPIPMGGAQSWILYFRPPTENL